MKLWQVLNIWIGFREAGAPRTVTSTTGEKAGRPVLRRMRYSVPCVQLSLEAAVRMENSSGVLPSLSIPAERDGNYMIVNTWVETHNSD